VKYLPSKLILATLVYLLSEAFNVTGLKCTVIASFCGVGLTLCKQNQNIKHSLVLLTHCSLQASFKVTQLQLIVPEFV